MKINTLNRDFQEALLIFTIVLTAYGYFSWGLDWNVNSRLALVKAFVEEGGFEIDTYVTQDLGTLDSAYLNGHYYTDKAIGASSIGAIVYFPIYWFCQAAGITLSTQTFVNLLTFLTVSSLAALFAPFSYLLIKHLTNNPKKAMVISLGISLGTPLFKYSTAYYGHSIVAVLYFMAVLIWFNANRRKNISLFPAFLSFFLLGLVIITEYPTALLLAVLLPYIIYTLYKSGQILTWKLYGAMALGFTIPIVILLYYNNSVFGTPFTTGYAYESSEAYNSAHQESVMGIGAPSIFVFWYQTFQPAFGIFWQSPILFLVFPGWIHMVRTREYRAESIFCFTAIFLYILMFSGYYMWWGGLSFTPRHLIPILPIFVLPLAFVPGMLFTPLALGGAISFFQNLVMTASGFEGLPAYLNEYLRPLWKMHGILQPKGMLVYDICLPNVIKGDLMNNRGLDLFGLSGTSTLLPLLFAEMGLLFLYLKVKINKSGS